MNGIQMPPTAAPAPRKLRRQQQRGQRREAILAAARKVFAQNGFDGTTMADIAREAGVAAGTVYLYYRSKTDLFAALQSRLFEVINQAMRDAHALPDVRDGTRARIHAIFAACAEHRDLVRLVFLNPDPRTEVARRMQRDDEERLAPLADLLRAGIEAGTVREADPLLLARLVTGLVIAALYQCFVISDGRDAATFEDTVTAMIAGGLSPAPYS
jgi:TetR/AcrR family fatty acid metabolism transcriptional regulator